MEGGSEKEGGEEGGGVEGYEVPSLSTARRRLRGSSELGNAICGCGGDHTHLIRSPTAVE